MADEHQNRPLSGEEKRVLARLGLPTFGLALSITAVTTYVPLLAATFAASTSVIGVIIGVEGLVALVVPLAAGAWSDQLRTRIGGRLPFLIAAAPPMALALALMGFAGSLWLLALLVLVFFIAYYTAYEPYRALYPDLLESEVAGRGQSTQALFRGAATGVALVGGGLLFGLSPRIPFLAFAVLALIAIGEFIRGTVKGKEAQEQGEHGSRTARETLHKVIKLLRENRSLRAFFVANALWELALAALKTFVVLFLKKGLGLSMTETVGVIAAAIVLILIAAPLSGKLGDRFGKARVATVALCVFGLGLLIPFFTHAPVLVLPTLPFVAFGGGVILTLPYAMLMPLMPEDEHGLLTGFYSLTRGVGILAGPLLGGFAISLLRPSLTDTHGYAAMWLVCAAAILLSIPFTGALRRGEQKRRARREKSTAEAAA